MSEYQVALRKTWHNGGDNVVRNIMAAKLESKKTILKKLLFRIYQLEVNAKPKKRIFAKKY